MEVRKVRVESVWGYELIVDGVVVKDVSKVDEAEILSALWKSGLRHSLIDIYYKGEIIWRYWLKPNELWNGYVESSYREKYVANLKEIIGN